MSVPSVVTQRRNVQRGIIDTTAPFDSVRTAVHRFGGSIDWKANRLLSLQKNSQAQTELEKVQDEIPKYKKQLEDAEVAKAKVLKELDNTKKLMEELQSSLEKVESKEANTKDRDIKQGITEELKTMKEELAALQGNYHRLVTEKDFAVAKAEEAISACTAAEKRAEELTVELITTKGDFKTEDLPIKDLQSKFEIATALLHKLKTRLEAHSNKKEAELEEVNASIKKAKDEVSLLKEENSSLKTELDHMKLEVELVMREQSAPKVLQQATEELNKAKEEAEEARAEAKLMEARLLAALKEVEVAKVSEELVLRAVKETGLIPSLELEEYYKLRKRVHEAEVLSNEKVKTVIEEIKDAKNGESANRAELEEAEKELVKKKVALRVATEEAELADKGKTTAEKELRELRERNDERGRASEGRRGELNRGGGASNCFSSKSHHNTVNEMKPKKKKSFFPRVLMFLARKKAQTLKKKDD